MTKTQFEHYQLGQDHPNRRECKRTWREESYRNTLAHDLRELRKNWDTWRELAKTLLEAEKYLESLGHSWGQKAWLELAQKLIKEWQWKIVVHHLDNFEWLDLNVAEKLIEQKKLSDVCCSIKSFRASDHPMIAERILDENWGFIYLLRRIKDIEWLNKDFHKKLAEKLVESNCISEYKDYISLLHQNTWPFSGEILAFINEKNKERCENLINEWKKYITKENRWSRWICVHNDFERYNLNCVKLTLKLIKMLDNWDSMEDVRKAITDRWDSHYAFCTWIAPMVTRFSKRGEEFNEYIKDKN